MSNLQTRWFKLFKLTPFVGIGIALGAASGAHAAVGSMSISGNWDYSISVQSCPYASPKGSVAFTYQNGNYSWAISGTNLDTDCNVVSYQCNDTANLGAEQITPQQLLGAIDSYCWDIPGGGSWKSATFNSNTQINLTGVNVYDENISIDLTKTGAAATPSDGLWIIDAENNGQSGRGFQIETRNNTLVFTYYGYRTGGQGHWYLAAGGLSNGNFSGTMNQYQGGTALGTAYRPATANGNAGTIGMTFTSSTTGSITLPGEAAKSISKFNFSGSANPTIVPSNGLWIIDAENNGQSGRGFQIEQNRGVLVFTYYGYDAVGQESWYLAAGAMSGNSFTGSMTQYQNGTVLGGSYAPATSSGSPGTVILNFTSPTSGTIQLPGEAAKPISKFTW